MTPDEINKVIEKLPSSDPEFIIGWLVTQLSHVTTELDESHILIHELRKHITYN